MKFFFLLLSIVIFSGCASMLSQINRRPFSDKVKYIGFSKSAGSAESIGNQTYTLCNRRAVFLGFFTTGSDPIYTDLASEITQEHKIKYMMNVRSVEYGESGFLMGKTCIALEGEAFK